MEELLRLLQLDPDKKSPEIIAALRNKSIIVPTWKGKKGLEAQYKTNMHPVMDKTIYPDVVTEDGIEKVTRITYDLQRLAVKRMTELVCGIPVKRVYHPKDDLQAEVANYMEAIYQRNRIDSVNVERLNMLFASCEVITLWYAVEQKNKLYGFDSDLKLRCRNFSPMNDEELYPLFDETGDMIALSVAYRRRVGRKYVNFFDTYTATKHYRWDDSNNGWGEPLVEDITIGKIPGDYVYRPTPIYEGTSDLVYEMEWAVSRNGNYLRRNSKPLFIVCADEEIGFGNEGDEKREFRAVAQYPRGSTAQYVTWQQAVENLKFFITELRQSFFTQLQLPDWSYESLKSTPMSGESRKQIFIDCQLKVKDESGRLLEFFDREANVVKAFMKAAMPDKYHAAIDALPVENVITPFTMTDEKDSVNVLMSANGGKPLMSQRESIEEYGHSSDVDKTMKEIAEESREDVMEQFQ